MGCLGVHFALTAEEVAQLRSFDDEQERLSHLQEVIEEHYCENEQQFSAESDKAWDAMHRVLADGELTWEGGRYPLNHVVLAGELLYTEADYIMSLKTPEQVRDAAAALPEISEAEFRRRWFATDAKSYDISLTKARRQYTWHWFQEVRNLFRACREARGKEFVLLTIRFRKCGLSFAFINPGSEPDRLKRGELELAGRSHPERANRLARLLRTSRSAPSNAAETLLLLGVLYHRLPNTGGRRRRRPSLDFAAWLQSDEFQA